MQVLVDVTNGLKKSISYGIKNSAKLPLSTCKGSVASRNNLAAEYTNKLVEELNKTSSNGEWTAQNFINALKKILGKDKIDFYVKREMGSDIVGSMGRVTTKEDLGKVVRPDGTRILKEAENFDKYEFSLPMKDNSDILEDPSNIVHETRHFFDYICNPKTINYRGLKHPASSEKRERFDDLYNSFVNDGDIPFVPMSLFKLITKSELKKMSDEETIDLLQTVRSSVKTEMNAYKQQQEFCMKNPAKHVGKLVKTWLYPASMKYESKLKFANQMLAERLKIAREALKKDIQNN